MINEFDGTSKAGFIATLQAGKLPTYLLAWI
jgi:hypothetical protein